MYTMLDSLYSLSSWQVENELLFHLLPDGGQAEEPAILSNRQDE